MKKHRAIRTLRIRNEQFCHDEVAEWKNTEQADREDGKACHNEVAKSNPSVHKGVDKV